MERNNFEKENEFLFNYSQKETIKKRKWTALIHRWGKCFSYSQKETISKKKMESGFSIDRKKTIEKKNSAAQRALIHRWGKVLFLFMERNNFEKRNIPFLIMTKESI